jgi:DNA replication protein DnaC
VGKSYLASVIGHQACSMRRKVMYFNTAKLFTLLKTSKADGSCRNQINKLEKQNLLILDYFGLKPVENINRHVLMEIIEDRYGQIDYNASKLPVSKWHNIIGEKTLADAILGPCSTQNRHKRRINEKKLKNKNQVKSTDKSNLSSSFTLVSYIRRRWISLPSLSTQGC